MILQLNPPIWVLTPKGEGFALLIIDYGIHLNSVWVVTIFDTGEVTHIDSNEVKVMGNSMLNIPDPKPFKERNI
jgi:hypothetical protein